MCESLLQSTVSTWVSFAFLCESPLQTVSTWAYCFTLLVCSHVWEFVVDCIHMGLLFYSFGLLPCVRVRCGLYSHGLTDLFFWFAPLCESFLQTVSTWVYCLTPLNCFFVWESVADCIHMDLLFNSFELLPCVRVCCGLYPRGLTVLLLWIASGPCVRVRCGLYPHGLTVLLFWFASLCESLLQTVSTWAYCFTLLVCSLMWESVADCTHMDCLYMCLWCTCLMPGSLLQTVPHGLCVSVMYLSHAWESAADCTT